MSAETPTAPVEPGSYLVKREKKYLSVKEDGKVDVLPIAHPWIVTIHNGRNRLKDPGTGYYLYDNSTEFVLDPGQNKHSLWEGASVKTYLPPTYY